MDGKQCSLYDVFYSVQIKQRFLKYLVSPFNVVFLTFISMKFSSKCLMTSNVSVMIACLLVVF